jgi:hypothetical protein
MRPFHAGSQDDSLFGTRPADGRSTPANRGRDHHETSRRKFLHLAARPAG